MNNNDDNRIRRRKVSSNDYNYKPNQNQRYYDERVNLENIAYNDKVENNKVKRANTNKRKKTKKKNGLKLVKAFLIFVLIASVVVSIIGSAFLVFSLKDVKPINKEILRENYISSEVVPDNEIPKYLKDKMIPGRMISIFGKTERRYNRSEFYVSDFEFIDNEAVISPKILPVYPTTNGLNQKNIRTMLEQAWEKYGITLLGQKIEIPSGR